MGSPKWGLAHLDGKSYLQHGHEVLDTICECVAISTTHKIAEIPYAQVHDLDEVGPLGGLLAAHQSAPEASWLVLACDLPAVRTQDLELLLELAGTGEAVAFANPIDGVAEATVTLYHASALRKLADHLSSGQRCARKFLDTLDLVTVPAPNPHTLQNVNYPADYREWQERARLGYQTPEINLCIEFYAKLRQEANLEHVEITTHSITVAGVWEECRLAYNLSLKQASVKPAVNNAFTPWEHELSEGDLVAFMPPFAGG